MAEYSNGDEPLDLTVLLPAYNEEDAIEGLMAEIRAALADWDGSWEILVVDDASTDDTAERARFAGARLVRRVENGGSGATRKSGILVARGELIAMLDADGSYDPASLPLLLSYFPDYDQVNGARTSEEGTHKFFRVPAKWVIRKLAELISGKRIPDLNTGLKVFKRRIMLRYLWVLPEGFSCVTSMTLAFLCNFHPVKYVSVPYRKRIGKSKFHPIKDSWNYFLTVIRIVMYFRPLRVFMPMGLALLIAGVVRGLYNVWASPLGLNDSDVMLFVMTAFVFSLGLLADLIVAQRRNGGTVAIVENDHSPIALGSTERALP